MMTGPAVYVTAGPSGLDISGCPVVPDNQILIEIYQWLSQWQPCFECYFQSFIWNFPHNNHKPTYSACLLPSLCSWLVLLHYIAINTFYIFHLLLGTSTVHLGQPNYWHSHIFLNFKPWPVHKKNYLRGTEWRKMRDDTGPILALEIIRLGYTHSAIS